jgi:DNA repair protein RadC
MNVKTRTTGIKVVGAFPWGTHVCQFYDSKEDLLDILVPYFTAGLESNEFCMWVTSELVNKEEAEEVMRQAVPNFAQYLERGQIEIIPYTKWYLKDDTFNSQRVQSAWCDKLDQALAKGYDGMRITGDVSWIGKRRWRDFIEYEIALNSVIGHYRMIVICTYCLGKCGRSEVIDVVSSHQFALIKQLGDWVVLKPREVLGRYLEGALPIQMGPRQLEPLQERFIRTSYEGFTDEECIELVLSLALPHQQSSQKAKECVERFGNLRGFVSASSEELQQAGIPPPCVYCIKLLHELPIAVLKGKIVEKSVYKSAKEVFDYLYYTMRDLKKEVFKVIYLNKRSQIIDTFDLFEGTLDGIPIRPREIVESAIKYNAAALIFVHNHPSGDPTPSKSDKLLTRDLVFMGYILQIKVLDHIIVGENRYFSFVDEGLIEKYEDSFLNLRIKSLFDIRSHFKNSVEVSTPLNR